MYDSKQSSRDSWVPWIWSSFYWNLFSALLFLFDYNGMNGSLCLRWHKASLIFLLNLPWSISFSLSCIIIGNTLSHWKNSESTSCALLLSFMGNEHHQPKSVAKPCVHLLPPLETVFANNVSLMQKMIICPKLANKRLVQHCKNTMPCGMMNHIKRFLGSTKSSVNGIQISI